MDTRLLCGAWGRKPQYVPIGFRGQLELLYPITLHGRHNHIHDEYLAQHSLRNAPENEDYDALRSILEVPCLLKLSNEQSFSDQCSLHKRICT